MVITILIFIAVLFVLVMVHEAGHFFASRKFGVKVDEFGFGIPPRVFGWRRKDTFLSLRARRTSAAIPLPSREKEIASSKTPRNDKVGYEFIAGNKGITQSKHTLFSLNWLPIGGFVKIKGENEEVAEPDSFSSQKAWKRVVILSSGVLANIFLAFIIFVLLFSVRSETYVPEGVSLKGARVTNESIKIVSVSKGSPAEERGVQSGDSIQDINSVLFETVTDVREYIQQRAGETLSLTLLRDGQAVTVQVAPRIIEGSGDRPLIGIQMAKSATVRYPIHLAVLKGFEATFVTLYQIVEGLVALLGQAVSGEKISGDIAGPVGIAVMTGQAARLGIVYILQFMALLSLNLAIINFFPFPALDGGRVLFIILEKVRGKKMKQAIEQWANTVGFSLLLLLILWVTIGDVRKLEIVTRVVDGVKNLF